MIAGIMTPITRGGTANPEKPLIAHPPMDMMIVRMLTMTANVQTHPQPMKHPTPSTRLIMPRIVAAIPNIVLSGPSPTKPMIADPTIPPERVMSPPRM